MNLLELKTMLPDFYQTLIEDPHGLFTADYHARFRDGAKGFSQEQFNIVIAGRFSVVKSRLIEVIAKLFRSILKHGVYPNFIPKK